MKERKHARPGARIILLTALLLAFAGLSLLVVLDKSRLRGLEESIAAMKEESVPMRFQVTARSGGGIEAKLKFYDSDGKEIAVAERAMKGESLYLDFLSVPVGGRFLSFPKAAFTEAIPAEKGLDLFGYYDSGGFPMVFAAAGMDRRTHDGLAALFLKLKLGNAPGGSFGNAVHDVKQFKSFEIGTVYKVVTRMKGGIEIMEDDE